MKTKKILSAFLAALMIFTLLPIGTFAEDENVVDSGVCGENLTWTLDADGTLTISGEGDMADYGNGWDESPFYNYDIKTVITTDGVTSLGDYAFYKHDTLTEITFCDSLVTIGRWAFGHCNGLTTVVIPKTVHVIDDYAFGKCSSLKKVILSPDSPYIHGHITSQTHLETTLVRAHSILVSR